MEIEIETTAAPGPGQLWLDVDGFMGAVKPGDGPRRDRGIIGKDVSVDGGGYGKIRSKGGSI